jgi:uncharacterized protein DUF5686/carboxypeptidase-like protein
MLNKKLVISFVILFGLFLNSSMSSIMAQKMTSIRGVVIDSKSKEPLPFVNVYFVGKNIGTVTDFDGYYELETQWASGQIQTSYIGYHDLVKDISVGTNQTINFQLESQKYTLEEVQITAKRKRYRNKNNPAVELIRKVIANKDKNRIENAKLYEYDKYEKVEFDLNNINEEFRNRKALKNFQYIFQYVDTSEINGKPYLPVFLKETISKVYFRKSPKSQKEHVTGTKMIGFHEYIDSDGISYFIDHLYQDVNLYENNINLLTNQFTSPISSMSPSIYKFHILDTLELAGHECIKLAFQPRNKADFAFIGDLYITNDGNYSLVKAEMKVSDRINLNFVNDLKIIQEFKYTDDRYWILVKDELIVDFNIGEKGIGMFGKRTVHTDNFLFNQNRDNEVYAGIEKTSSIEGHSERDEEFWQQNRLVDLSEQEKNIYIMVDSVQNIPAFKRTMDIVMLLVAGYWNFGYVDVGPVNTFYSFNDVEGLRLRLGGRTSDKFSKMVRLDGYLLYGFNDERYKYSLSSTFSLNKRPLKERPRNDLKLLYQVETNFPGMEMMFINEDNFLLSFKRGIADKIIYYNMFEIEHVRDFKNGFSTTFSYRNLIQKPGGTLKFEYADGSLDSEIVNSEFTSVLRFAPNEIYYQGMAYRTPVISKYPIFQLSYTQGIVGFINGDYTYGKLKFNFFKRYYLGPLGFTNTEIETGKVFGEVPFPLMFVHRANQTYSYQLRSYNLMNFLEFVSDEYVSVYIEHHFNGFIFNKIPLFKRLQFREIISIKGIYGNVTDKNNPDITPGLMEFPTDSEGNPTTFTLYDEPYMEASVGVGNIFKVFRVDLVKRLSYLDNPDVSDIGVRVRFRFEF